MMQMCVYKSDQVTSRTVLQATFEGVAALQRRVAGTSLAAMGIVASIVGAPSTQVRSNKRAFQVSSESVAALQRPVAGTWAGSKGTFLHLWCGAPSARVGSVTHHAGIVWANA